jgi:hypothetical protein
VDQRLAVEAHLAPCTHSASEAVEVLHVVVDAVEDHLAGLPGGEQRGGEVRQQRRAARHVLGAQLLGEVVGAHDEHGHAGMPAISRTSRMAVGVSTIAQMAHAGRVRRRRRARDTCRASATEFTPSG